MLRGRVELPLAGIVKQWGNPAFPSDRERNIQTCGESPRRRKGKEVCLVSSLIRKMNEKLISKRRPQQEILRFPVDIIPQNKHNL